MVEERYHATTQNRFYPDMYNKNITVEVKLINPPMYNRQLICYPILDMFRSETIIRILILTTQNMHDYIVFHK
jgi:hypothetical protein